MTESDHTWQPVIGPNGEVLRDKARPPFDPMRPPEQRSEAEEDRHQEYAQDAADDARVDAESEG